MATKRQRARRARRRKAHAPGALQEQLRSILPKDAPTALPLREAWAGSDGQKLRAHYRTRVRESLRGAIADAVTFEPIVGVFEASSAWPALFELHELLVARVADLTTSRGTGEWIWWLRRLAGQFDEENQLESTGPYVQHLAEALVTAVVTPSTPVPDRPDLTFEFSEDVLLDLAWVSEIALTLYELHSTMKRCAKGQSVEFFADRMPTWVPDEELDAAIGDYDRRSWLDTLFRLGSVGLAQAPVLNLRAEVATAGMVPHWSHSEYEAGAKFSVADPPPCVPGLTNLDAVTPLHQQAALNQDQVALIAVLWAVQLIAMRDSDEDLVLRRMTTPLQWGYAVVGMENMLVPALDRVAVLMKDQGGQALRDCWTPTSAQDVLLVLDTLRATAWPPICGNPVHPAGEFALVDLVGASFRLFSTMERPADGPRANEWADEFESDVQSIIDETAWRPNADLRSLKGRRIKRRNGTTLTDIDAVGFLDNVLLLVSCKSTRFPVAALRGEHSVTRSLADKVDKAAADWLAVLDEVRADPGLLGMDGDWRPTIDGCVVFPRPPFVRNRDLRMRTGPAGCPFLGSASELAEALGYEESSGATHA